MIITKPGFITQRILLLGRIESCIYLIKGSDEYALLGGGMANIIPDVLSQFEKFDIDERRIKRLFILHSHFDHVGTVAYFKKRMPWITVIASRKTRDRFNQPKALSTIIEYSKAVLAANGMEDKAQEYCLDVRSFVVDEVVSEGSVLTCGDLEMQILETPGHSSCSIAVYVPQEKALFASDAGGIPFGDTVFTAANSNYDLYQQSLEKMAAYDVEVHLAEHYGALTGQDGKSFVKRSIEIAKENRNTIEEIYARTMDEPETVAQVTDSIMQQADGYFLPPDIMKMVIAQMIHYLVQHYPADIQAH